MKKNDKTFGIIRFSGYLILFFAILCVSAYGIKSLISKDKQNDALLVYENVSDGSIIARTTQLKEENFWGDGKRHVRIKNLSDYAAYVKVTPYFTARDENGLIRDCIIRDEEFLDLDLANWVKIGDSYYYSTPLEAKKYTTFLVKDCRETDSDGNMVSVRFQLQGIDAEDRQSVKDKWHIELTEKGEILG